MKQTAPPAGLSRTRARRFHAPDGETTIEPCTGPVLGPNAAASVGTGARPGRRNAGVQPGRGDLASYSRTQIREYRSLVSFGVPNPKVKHEDEKNPRLVPRGCAARSWVGN